MSNHHASEMTPVRGEKDISLSLKVMGHTESGDVNGVGVVSFMASSIDEIVRHLKAKLSPELHERLIRHLAVYSFGV